MCGEKEEPEISDVNESGCANYSDMISFFREPPYSDSAKLQKQT
jgi:hypothetical protein